MIVIAVLVLPMVAAVLLLMDRVEDWMSTAPSVPRHAGERRHLSLIPGGTSDAHAEGATTAPSPESREQAA
ncbi:hypothetical protein [Streptomyces sp. NPDC057616]|uniref:hypothetical protein n=1 Tax=Streptomyces sp. NPDC057616 TaxID=3346183 RepID=UPI00369FC688